MSMLILINFVISYSQSLCYVPGCLSCSSFSPQICINCEPGLSRSLNGCVRSDRLSSDLVENCFELDNEGLCLSCLTGFILSDNACEPECPEDCTCFEPNNCINANEQIQNFETRTKRSLSCSDYYCTSCADYYGTCYECYDGYYASGSSCNDCLYSCRQCSNSYTCTSCYSGYYLSSQYCYSCPTGCNECSDYYSCSSCKGSYYLSGGTCYLDCPSNCNSCSSAYYCDYCDSGYYENYGTCEECSSHCKRCGSYYYCYECESGYKLDNYDCVSSTSKIVVLIVAPIVSVAGFIIIVIIIVCLVKRRVRRIREMNNKNFAVTPHNNVVTTFAQPIPDPPVYNTPYAPQGINPVIIPPASNTSFYPPPVPSTGFDPTHQAQPYGAPIKIDYTNFIQLVPLVTLDTYGRYLDQENCRFCEKSFSTQTDTRVLPCQHAFHGECVYNQLAIGTYKNCPVCHRQYL